MNGAVGDFGSANKVTAQRDEGVSNCYMFTIQREDHTLGNLLTQELLEERRVLFAGYRIHHPLNDFIYVRVNVSDTIEKPKCLVEVTIEKLQGDIEKLSRDFSRQVHEWNTRAGSSARGQERP